MSELSFHHRGHEILYRLERTNPRTREFRASFTIWNDEGIYVGGNAYEYANRYDLFSTHRAVLLGGLEEVKSTIRSGNSFPLPIGLRHVEDHEIRYWNLEVIKGGLS